LDSGVLIAAEREGKNPRQVIEEIAAKLGDTEATLSVITVTELAHGIERADSATRRNTRERFLQELLSEISVEPVTTRLHFARARSMGAFMQRACESLWPIC
jgi:tRNA(fMet)-specific endonuclease VapC